MVQRCQTPQMAHAKWGHQRRPVDGAHQHQTHQQGRQTKGQALGGQSQAH